MYDAAIVLGHVSKHGKLSLRQIKRANKAFELFKTGAAKNIITTGGIGGLFNNTDTPLGKQVKEYLLDLGVPEDSIFEENASKNTQENAINSLEIMKTQNFKSAMVITSFPHNLRANVIFKRVFKGYIISTNTSDYWVGIVDTVWDIAWEIGGWIKLYFF
jgi:uncharacterized SAM-binding protein YcdF (DUF218 family)